MLNISKPPVLKLWHYDLGLMCLSLRIQTEVNHVQAMGFRSRLNMLEPQDQSRLNTLKPWESNQG